MSEGLRSHVRYPQDFFSVQAEKYIKYHMKDPNNFYNDEDLWARPNEKFGQGDDLQVVEPYYVIMKLPGEETEEFVQLLPYTPSQRQNLIGWLAARSDGENYGKLVAFNFPKDRQIDGPEQIEARIDNDQEISAWFTLRCSEGSACIRGNLLVIPIGDSLLFVETGLYSGRGGGLPGAEARNSRDREPGGYGGLIRTGTGRADRSEVACRGGPTTRSGARRGPGRDDRAGGRRRSADQRLG